MQDDTGLYGATYIEENTLLENLRPPPECPRTLEDPDPSPIVWLIVGILGGRFLLPAGLTFV